jgi:hypothetical protein
VIANPLCVCGQRASHHDTPDSGDTRCLAVEAREDLLYGRDTVYGVAMTPAAAPTSDGPTVYLLRRCRRRRY